MTDKTSAALLNVRDVHAFYGESHVLHGIDISIGKGEIVTLLGRNGAGKTTLLRTIMGIVSKRSGSIVFDGTELMRLQPHKIPRLGIGYVPEERAILSSLDVFENLTLPPVIKPGGLGLADLYTLFPNLKGREKTQGTRLSGGEQQMLAIARILRTGADFILLDEPTEGLAPVIIQQIGSSIRALKERGFTIVLVEQNFRFASELANRHYVIEEGRVVDSFASEEIPAKMTTIQSYLGV
jgi:branched-chain amino acid transport system ATP-binding protein